MNHGRRSAASAFFNSLSLMFAVKRLDQAEPLPAERPDAVTSKVPAVGGRAEDDG